MNRQLWDNFLEQIDAQVEGDFLSLAAQYEAVVGHPFKVKSYTGNNLLFSMLEQAMKTQHKELLTLTIQFISQLPLDLQRQFQIFGRRRVSGDKLELDQDDLDVGHLRHKQMANKLWDFLHLNRTA